MTDPTASESVGSLDGEASVLSTSWVMPTGSRWRWRSLRAERVDQAFQSFSDRRHDMHFWSRTRIAVHMAVNHQVWNLILVVVIAFNLGVVVVETNYAADEENNVPSWMTTLNTTIAFVFVLELALRMFVEQKNFFHSGINLFDTAIVTVDASTTCVRLATEWDSVFPLEIFRAARVLKILRAVRLMTFFPQLKQLLLSFIHALEAIAWASLVVIFALMFWALFAVILIHPVNQRLTKAGYWELQDCERCPRAFESVQQSMLTFAQQIIAGDSWGKITLPIIEHEPITSIFFFGVLMSISLAVMNLVLAVIVEKAAEARETSVQEQLNRKDQHFERASQELFAICEELDKDGSGRITFAEFVDGFRKSVDFADIMKSMDMGESDLSLVFNMLDVDGSQYLDYKEFVDQLHMIKSRESHTLLVFIRFFVSELDKKVNLLTKHLAVPQMPKNLTRRASFGVGGGRRRSLSAPEAAARVPHASPRAPAARPGESQYGAAADRTATTSPGQESSPPLDTLREFSDMLRSGEASRAQIQQQEAMESASLDAEAIGAARSGEAGRAQIQQQEAMEPASFDAKAVGAAHLESLAQKASCDDGSDLRSV